MNESKKKMCVEWLEHSLRLSHKHSVSLLVEKHLSFDKGNHVLIERDRRRFSCE